MRFRLISLLALIFLFQNLALASHLSSPKVSDYLQAKVSDSINDYKSTIKFYQKLHKHNPRDTVIINKLLMASILDGDLLNANAYAFRLANVSCSPSITTSCVKIQSDNCIIRLWIFRFFFNRNNVSFFIELRNTRSFWILNIISKYSRFTI